MFKKKRKRMCEIYLANLIAESYTTEIRKWVAAEDINCYAFSRRLTYPNKYQDIYTPGMIYKLKFGSGEITHTELDPHFINACIMRDSIALNQPCTRVSFDEIREDDGYYYFGLAEFYICPSKITDERLHYYLKDVDDEKTVTHEWHFICRTPYGIWVHKPNWKQASEEIEWEVYGKSFVFSSYNTAFGGLYVPARGICFDQFFYRVENNYALH